MGLYFIQERKGNTWTAVTCRRLSPAFRFRHAANARIRRYARRHGLDRGMFRLVHISA